MKFESVEGIANAVLYEGYMLYPYRRSAIKNRQRFNFGVLYPRQYCELNPGSDDWRMQTECLVLGAAPSIEVKVRFLQMVERRSGQEGIERAITTPVLSAGSMQRPPHCQAFAFEVPDAEGTQAGQIEGEVILGTSRLDEELHKVTLQVHNRTRLDEPGTTTRDHALLRSLVSVHSILRVEGGEFSSAIDPREPLRAAAAGCRNVGAFPVLAGEEGRSDLMLSSPIILYDYPRIAPESPGDLCDGTEIDEILALRILTMTDQEKREVREGDERARHILERTELLPPEHFQKLHGALRGLRGSAEEPR